MRTVARATVLVLSFLFPLLALAEEGRSRGAPRVQEYEEVERGFWLRSTFGVAVNVTDMFDASDRESPVWPPGAIMGLELGVDLGQVASIHLAFYGQQVPGNHNLSSGRAEVSNDAGSLLVMAGARFNLATTKRLGWFLKVGAGYMLSIPEDAMMDNSFAIQAGTGVEYATNLRHFFIGLEAAGGYLITSGGVSILLTPTVKYTF